MTSKITLGYRRLIDEANAQIRTIPSLEAVKMASRENVAFVDLRDPREIKRDGSTPGRS